MLTYGLVVAQGYVRLVRRGERPPRRLAHTSFVRHGNEWVEQESQPDDVLEAEEANEALVHSLGGDDAYWADNPDQLDPYLEAAIDDTIYPRRGDTGQSSRSRMNMRRLFVSLPWELVGPRPALISLTYPGLWQPWVPDGRVWEAHRRAFERRWVRRWGEPLVGVWVKEFQTSGRPHLYVGLPNSMAAEDYVGLRERTLQRHRLERQYGRYEGRKRTPPLGIPYGGDFGRWLRAAWSETVGTAGPAAKVTTDPGSAAHEVRGAAVAVMFWSDEAEAKTDRTVVAQYLAREAGKWRQKQPPPGFVKVGRFYGVWGKSAGFHPEATTTMLEPLVAAEVEARLARWVNRKLHTLRKESAGDGDVCPAPR
jgi:hypothetical protein